MDIASMLEVEVQEVVDSKENVTPIQKQKPNYPCKNFSADENDFYKLTYGSDVASVRFLRLHCTGCDEHIGSAPAEAHNMHEHPVLRTLFCAKCREFYGDGTFEQGDDATDMFCRWCANGGNLYCCSYCSNTFCSKCIKRNFDPPTIKRIEAEDAWKCFVCDPKDLFPLRSITRALIIHIETVTSILENDRRMNPKEIEEKMHLDETKCCSRKRKRRRRRTLSNSDDEEEDSNYVPEIERPETPPVKKRKIRKSAKIWIKVDNNGYMDHEYYNSKRKTKIEPDVDEPDIMIPCEQSMIEGETEINHTDTSTSVTVENKNVSNSSDNSHNILKPTQPPPLSPIQVQPQTQVQPYQQQLQLKPMTKNSMAINPVPLANLLKVALSTGAKKIKVTHTPNQKLVAVPMSAVPKAIASSSLSFIKPARHFLVPKILTKNLPQPRQILPKSIVQQEQPSVIDLDSDDEPVILESNHIVNHNNSDSISEQVINIINDMETDENVVPDQVEIERNCEVGDDEPVVICTEPKIMTRPRSSNTSVDGLLTTTIDGSIPLKQWQQQQQRDQRFKKMLILQSQEIDSTLGELKTKILKLIQTSNNKTSETDLLNTASVYTKRFHRALRKTLVELSHINDRVVRDYLDWKKKNDKMLKTAKVEENKEKINSDIQFQSKDHLTLEMICVRESDSESNSEDELILSKNENHIIEASNIPPDYSNILDHLTIFKRKPTGVKAVGDSSIFTEDKACQAYDVPWKDYEKCIGYSLLTRSEYDSSTQKNVNHPVVSDEHFGKYQEQYLFYLQHIEDFGIETDELKGLPDPNHIPLKDLIDSTSPFITDMLERLSPVTLSNGCTSPSVRPASSTSSNLDIVTDPISSPKTTIVSSPPPNNNKKSQNQISEPASTLFLNEVNSNKQENEIKTVDENMIATSKAVENLVKMVTKLSEDLHSEDITEIQEADEIANQEEVLMVVDSIQNTTDNKNINDEVVDICMTTLSNDDCTIVE